MTVFGSEAFAEHDFVVHCRDRRSGLSAIIAIHDLTLGPALGGCRMHPYASEDAALCDVLRLSRGMTFKNALAGLPLGGAKAVIIGDPRRDKSRALWHAFGRFVETLGGRYWTAQDAGVEVEDMRLVAEATRYAAGVSTKARETSDPSPLTAFGTYRGIQAAALHRFGHGDLNGLHVVVQGLGHVGQVLCQHLYDAGARLSVADLERERVQHMVERYGAEPLLPEAVYDVEADVFAPCALGGVLNADTIPRLGVGIVAGAANNQLATAEDGLRLAERGILYAPDYVINAGGVMAVATEVVPELGEEGLYDRVSQIHDTLLGIFAAADGEPTSAVADRLARERLDRARLEGLAA